MQRPCVIMQQRCDALAGVMTNAVACRATKSGSRDVPPMGSMGLHLDIWHGPVAVHWQCLLLCFQVCDIMQLLQSASCMYLVKVQGCHWCSLCSFLGQIHAPQWRTIWLPDCNAVHAASNQGHQNGILVASQATCSQVIVIVPLFVVSFVTSSTVRM